MTKSTAQSSKWIAVCRTMEPILLPALNFIIPGVHAGQTDLGGGENVSLIIPGDTITYDPLDFDFLIDHDYKNYQQVFEWLHRITNTNDIESELVTITLYLLSNYGEISNFCVELVNAWPTDLSVIPYDNTNETTDLQASITMSFERILMKRCCTTIEEILFSDLTESKVIALL